MRVQHLYKSPAIEVFGHCRFLLPLLGVPCWLFLLSASTSASRDNHLDQVRYEVKQEDGKIECSSPWRLGRQSIRFILQFWVSICPQNQWQDLLNLCWCGDLRNFATCAFYIYHLLGQTQGSIALPIFFDPTYPVVMGASWLEPRKFLPARSDSRQAYWYTQAEPTHKLARAGQIFSNTTWAQNLSLLPWSRDSLPVAITTFSFQVKHELIK